MIKYPKLPLATLHLLVHQDLAGSLQLVHLQIRRHQPRHVDAQRFNRLPRVETLRVSFPLDKDLKLLLHQAVGRQPSNKEALVPIRIHKHRGRPIGVAITPNYSRLRILPWFRRRHKVLLWNVGFPT